MNSNATLIRVLVILGFVGLVFLAGCGGKSQSSNNQPPPPSGSNPTPTISFLDPSCAPVGGSAFTLKVWGTNFVASSVVRWNGSDRPTTVNLNAIINGIKGAVATAQIPASDISAGGTAAVTVFNPATGGGSSNPATFTIAAGGVDPQAVAVAPTGKFAYVANGGCPNAFAGNVSMYTIDATTGALTSIGSPVPAELLPQSVAVDPTGKFAYVTNLFSNSVLMYSINATTGALTSMGLVPAGARPASVAVDPTGKFAYVANNGYGLGGVSMYTINAATGALTPIGMIDAGTSPVSLAVDPTGKFAYVANFGDASADDFGSVSMYTINATTGALTSTGTIYGSCPGLCGPQSVAVDPTGRFAYVANLGGPPPTVSMFTIDGTTGALTSIGTVTAAAEGLSVAVDPKGKFVYVTEVGGKVSGYSINATTGVLTSVGTIAAAGLCLNSIAIHTSGQFAYLGDSCSNKVLIYSIDATTGALTLIGAIGT